MDYHQIWIIIRIVETEINLELIQFFTEICQHLWGFMSTPTTATEHYKKFDRKIEDYSDDILQV
jgi:hypothetical protein